MSEYLIALSATDAVAVNLPPGTTIRAVRDGQPLSFTPPGDEPVIAVLWGTAFGGAWICSYGSLAGVRNGHHRRDRWIWHQAAELIRYGGAARIGHETQAPHGRRVLVATSVREVAGQDHKDRCHRAAIGGQ